MKLGADSLSGPSSMMASSSNTALSTASAEKSAYPLQFPCSAIMLCGITILHKLPLCSYLSWAMFSPISTLRQIKKTVSDIGHKSEYYKIDFENVKL